MGTNFQIKVNTRNMKSKELSQNETINAVYSYAATLKDEGKSDKQIVNTLVEKGIEKEGAEIITKNINKAIEAKKEAGGKNMLYGALWCIGGIVVTAVTFSAASGGGTYIVAWGAIVFGAIQFFKGLIQSLS